LGWILFLAFVLLHTAKAILELPIPDIHLPLINAAGFEDDVITDELILSGVLIGLLFIAFAKEKNEDEYITVLRLKSWQWAVLISYGILLIATWLIFGLDFLGFMAYNMFTVLIVFIVKFNYSLYLLRKGGSDEN
jgi:hypothetical protein